MLSFLSWIGLSIFGLALSFDFYREWLAPRLLSRSWFPGEPDLPPVAGEVNEPEPEDIDRVLLAGYAGVIMIVFIGSLDAAPVNPDCLPHSDFIQVYLVKALALTTGLMWYSEGKDVVISYHSEVRYIIGFITVVLPVYSKACGTGVL
jgi:hypothetical protein